MRRWLNPRRLVENIRRIRSIRRGGGPRRIQVRHVSKPKGIIAPTSDVVLDVEARDGTVTEIQTFVPVPWPLTWTWRIGRALHLPVLSKLDPERVRFALNVPGRG